MKPVRTDRTNCVFKLPGGTDENDLPVERRTADGEDDGAPVLVSTWQLTDAERAWIAEGGRVELIVWGSAHPAVAMHIEKKGEILGRWDDGTNDG